MTYIAKPWFDIRLFINMHANWCVWICFYRHSSSKHRPRVRCSWTCITEAMFSWHTTKGMHRTPHWKRKYLESAKLLKHGHVIKTMTRATSSQLAKFKDFKRIGFTKFKTTFRKIESFARTRDMLLESAWFGACANVLLIRVLSTFWFSSYFTKYKYIRFHWGGHLHFVVSWNHPFLYVNILFSLDVLSATVYELAA